MCAMYPLLAKYALCNLGLTQPVQSEGIIPLSMECYMYVNNSNQNKHSFHRLSAKCANPQFVQDNIPIHTAYRACTCIVQFSLAL